MFIKSQHFEDQDIYLNEWMSTYAYDFKSFRQKAKTISVLDNRENLYCKENGDTLLKVL